MVKGIRLAAAAICLPALPGAPACHAEQRPLWEVGAGLSGLSLPDYRGSSERGAYVLPVPYLVYRGDFLKADRDGLRGLLFDSERVEVNVSLNGSLPGNGDDNPARSGMAELDPTAELGPSVNVHLWKAADRRTKLELRMPVRTGITVASDPDRIGWLFAPHLHLVVRDAGGFAGWNLGLQAGPYFQDRDYNAYFYSVPAADATPARPAYTARGGYSGTQVSASLTRRHARYWVCAFVRYDTLAGTVIDDSPLVETRHAVSGGIALSWVFAESAKRVEAEE
jgi:outer membrane scaffolding protein for murein synthesis (MipA/OmpV family)